MRRKRGFTLVELVVSLALIGLVISLGSNILLTSFKIPGKALNEYDVQSKLRLLSHHVNVTIRDASATFALFRTNANNLTSGWNYVMPNADHSSIIEYRWNGTSHDMITLVESQEGVTFDLIFVKNNPADVDNLLELKFVANVNGETREIQSEIEALNSLQVIDRGSTSYPSNTLAYRTDSRPTIVSDVQAAISMVFDKSGSMAWRLDGSTSVNDSSTNSAYWSRMKQLKIEAKRLVDALSTNPNIYISLSPFSTSANASPASLYHTMLQAWVSGNDNDDILGMIDGMSANGGTNTGDGIRRGYYSIVNYNNDPNGSPSKIVNFMIILVDGCSTFSSVTRINDTNTSRPHDSITYFTGENNINETEFDTTTSWWGGMSSTDFNTDLPDGRYYGYGNSLDPIAEEYIQSIGNSITRYGEFDYSDMEPVKTYVIGFSQNSADFASLNNIATATGATGPSEIQKYYTAGSSAALETIFNLIKKDINDTLWYIAAVRLISERRCFDV